MSSGSRSSRNLRGPVEIISSDEEPTTTALRITGSLCAKGNILPDATSDCNLGSPEKRWQNIYTMDLHLANDRGNWTVIEEEDYLSLRNNKNGKRYKLVMEELPENGD
jgi:hypothetical protein